MGYGVVGLILAPVLLFQEALNIGDVDIAICVLGVNDVISETSLGKWLAMQK